MYIQPTPNLGGAYPTPQGHNAPGLIPLTDEQAAMVIQYNGFVILSEGDDGETIVTPNIEAWEAWKEAEAAKPTPEPEATDTEVLNTLLGVTE